METKQIMKATMRLNLPGRLIKTGEFKINTEKVKIAFCHKSKFW